MTHKPKLAICLQCDEDFEASSGLEVQGTVAKLDSGVKCVATFEQPILFCSSICLTNYVLMNGEIKPIEHQI